MNQKQLDALKNESPAGMTLLLATEALDEWKANNPPEVIKQKTKSLLDNNSNEIVAKLLGFEQKYGGQWEIDHCNGRRGNSPVGVEISKIHQEAISEWVKTICMPTVSKKTVEKIKKELNHEFEYAYRKKFRELLLQHAESEASRVFEQLKVTGVLDNMDMLNKMLENQSNPQN